MDPELRDIIRGTAVEPVGDSHTHVSLFGPTARWTVRPQNHSSFWSRYCDLVDLKTNGRGDVAPDPYAPICLAERPTDVMPLIADLTFRFHAEQDDQGWEPYDDEFLMLLCYTYQSVIAEFFRTSETQLELTVVTLESTTHWIEEDRENGGTFMNMNVRLQFPYGRIDAGMQNRVIRPRVIQLLRNNNAIARLNRQPIGDWNDIISTTSATDPVVMYGSSCLADRPKLKLTHIWTVITREMIDDGTLPEEVHLEDAFVPINHGHVQQQTVNPDIFDNYDLNYWLPMFLSLSYWPAVMLPKEEILDTGRFAPQMRVAAGQNQQAFGTGYKRAEYTEESDSELAERMIVLLGNHRYLREAFWVDIGKALYVSNEGAENGLMSWIRHTERALAGVVPLPEFLRTAPTVPEVCRNLYYTFANSSITVKTLAWYAREDAPERYASWHKDWCTASMEQALSCYHTDVAIALRRVYWLDFTYCPVGKGKWFWFRNHRHFEVNQGIELRKAISSDFRRRFEMYRSVLSTQVHESNDEAFKANGEITMKKLSSLIGKLKTVAFKSSIMFEACEHFTDDKFVTLLDSNPDITGVTNGVLEVSGHHVIFRNAKPEDYVSMCTNIPYHSNYTWQHPLVAEAMKWFGQVFTDRDLLHHFLKFGASCLKGRNSDKIFPVFTGEGDNSKSMIVKLFEATFNSYCIKFDISNVTGRNGNASGPTPQLARSKATRIAFMDEPEDDVPMHKGIIKKWVGGDSFFARLLHNDGGDVQVTFKLVLTCNKVPTIPNADRAIKNRTKLFPFLSTWLKEGEAPEDEAEQYAQRKFKMNPFFERRIPILAPAFLWILSQYYPHYATQGLVDPKIISETTEAYWKDNDVYAQFAADSIAEVYNEANERDAKARVTLSEIYSEFKLWFRDSFPGTKIPERSIVKTELSSRWGRMQGNAWHGIRLINTTETTENMTATLGGRQRPVVNVAKPGTVLVQNPVQVEVAKPAMTPKTLIKVATPNRLPAKPYSPNTLLVKPVSPVIHVPDRKHLQQPQLPQGTIAI